MAFLSLWATLVLLAAGAFALAWGVTGLAKFISDRFPEGLREQIFAVSLIIIGSLAITAIHYLI